MSTYEINHENLLDLDSYLHVDDPDAYDREIEDIVAGLWGSGNRSYASLAPFFTTYLQSNLLRPLYIHYLALSRLKDSYDQIVVNASTVILDIVGEALELELNPNRTFHDEEFYLVRRYEFSPSNRQKRPYWKRMALTLGSAWMAWVYRLRGLDVLYLNAGKLDNDLSRIPRSMSALWVPLKRSGRSGYDAQAIGVEMRENILAMDLSIPNDLVVQLVERRVLAHLPDALDRIGALTEFIEQHRVKLVITSAVTHEDHLCLLTAARLSGIDGLLMSHGITLAKNAFLDHRVTYQATINGIEPTYEGAIQFPMKARWLERNV